MAELIKVDFDTSGMDKLADKFDKHLSFAVVDTINEIAKLIQKVEQERAQQNLTLRSDFIRRRSAVIKPFANVSQGRPYAEIAINDGNTNKGKLILGKLETGGEKDPSSGAKSAATAITGSAARPDFSQQVARNLMIKQLHLHRTVTKAPSAGKPVSKGKGRKKKYAPSAWHWTDQSGKHRSQGGKTQVKGSNHTFLMRTRRGDFGVFQRIGTKSKQIELLWYLKPSFKLRKKLQWMNTAHEIADKYLQSTLSYNLKRKGLVE